MPIFILCSSLAEETSHLTKNALSCPNSPWNSAVVVSPCLLCPSTRQTFNQITSQIEQGSQPTVVQIHSSIHILVATHNIISYVNVMYSMHACKLL